MYPLAVQHGIPADRYWSMTYDEIVTQVEANRKKDEEELKERAYFDYTQAQLSTYSVNDPKKMPSIEKIYPFLQQTPQLTKEEEFKQEMKTDREYMMLRAAQIKKTQEIKKNGGE